MQIQNSIKSVLNMDKLIVNRIEFDRIDEDFTYDNLNIEVDRIVEKIDSLKFKVFLETRIKCPDEHINVYIKVSGCFSLNQPWEDKTEEFPLLNNAVAIMFPFVRSQITLITSQPNMQPIVLPPININALLEKQL